MEMQEHPVAERPKLNDRDQRSLEVFQRKMQSLLNTSSKSENSASKWYIYACYINPSAALGFQRLAEELDQQCRSGENNAPIEPLHFFDDPLSWFTTQQYNLITSYECEVSNWIHMHSNLMIITFSRCRIQFTRLFFLRYKLAGHYQFLISWTGIPDTSIPHDLKTEWGTNCEGPDIDAAFRAIENMLKRLDNLIDYLKEFCGLDAANSAAAVTSSSQIRTEVVESEAGTLRRRRNASPAPASEETNIADERVRPATKTEPWAQFFQISTFLKGIISIGFASMPTSRRALHTFLVDQTTLQSLSFLSTTAAALATAISVSKFRAKDCENQAFSFDDGFWALISQCFTQSMVFYCTAAAVARDKNMPIPAFWFWAASLGGFTLGVVTPIVYAVGASWRTVAMMNYASNAAGLLTSLLLTKGLQRVYMRTELGPVELTN